MSGREFFVEKGDRYCRRPLGIKRVKKRTEPR